MHQLQASQIRGLVQQIDVIHAYNLFKLILRGLVIHRTYTKPEAGIKMNALHRTGSNYRQVSTKIAAGIFADVINHSRYTCRTSLVKARQECSVSMVPVNRKLPLVCMNGMKIDNLRRKAALSYHQFYT